MKPLSSLFAGAAMAVGLAATAAEAQDGAEAGTPTISSIVIDADITAIGSREAAAYWRNLPADLEEAIVRELFDSIGAEGVTLRVAVDELSLAEAFENDFADARLAGQVQLVDAAGEPLTGAWEVAAAAREAEALLPADVEVEVLSRTTPEFYDAVVGAFARGVAQVFEAEVAADF